ncbi:hypothetical protein L7F22_028866 [Adiantum nelumboides]|nr:hypothetical protein [Adiantum nelumboides]
MAKGGMNVVRINMCHGSKEWHAEVIDNIRKLNAKKGYNVTIMMDGEVWTFTMHKLKGPLPTRCNHVNFEGFAEGLFENIIAQFGCTFEIVSDSGTHFMNEVIKELTSNFMISHHKSTPYYPQANGQAESTNKTLISVLTKIVEAHRTDWDLKLTSALWAHQTAYKVAINCTPFKMVYGQEVVMPWEFVIPSLRVASQESWDGNLLVERLYILEHLEEGRQLAVYNALIEKDKRKKWFDRHLKDKDIKVGDKVLMYGVRNEKKKLKYAGKGPYQMCKITPQGTIHVETKFLCMVYVTRRRN